MIQKRPSETYPCPFQTAFLCPLYLSLILNKPWLAAHFFSCIYFQIRAVGLCLFEAWEKDSNTVEQDKGRLKDEFQTAFFNGF